MKRAVSKGVGCFTASFPNIPRSVLPVSPHPAGKAPVGNSGDERGWPLPVRVSASSKRLAKVAPLDPSHVTLRPIKTSPVRRRGLKMPTAGCLFGPTSLLNDCELRRFAAGVNADEAPLGTGIGCLVHADRDAIDLRRCRAALRHIHIEDSECAGWVVSGVGYNNTCCCYGTAARERLIPVSPIPASVLLREVSECAAAIQGKNTGTEVFVVVAV